MPEFFVYLLKINIAISLFYLVYYVLLRKLTFYSLNRFYLLFSILLSGIFPFLSIPSIFSEPEIVSYNFQVVEGSLASLPQVEDSQSSVWLVLTVAYWLLVIFGGLKFLARLISLYRIHLKSTVKFWGGYVFNDLSLEITPFSFLKNTYLNFNKHSEKELYTILKHEEVHTKNLHSLDVLLIEIWTLLSWFNPISWMLKKAIEVNCEFIADREVVRQGASYQYYQQSLLDFAVHTYNIPLTNQFSFISLKSRIIMMNKKRSSKRQLGKYLLIIPIVVFSLFAFGVKSDYQSTEPLETFFQELPLQDEMELSQDSSAFVKTPEQLLNKIIGDTISVRTKSGIEPLIIIDGVEQEKIPGKNTLSTISPETIESVSVLKGESAIAIYGEKGGNGVILVSTKKKVKGVNGEEKTVIEGKDVEKGTSEKDGSSLGKDTISVEVRGFSKESLEARSEKDSGKRVVKPVVVLRHGSIPKSDDGELDFSLSNIDASLMPSKLIKGLYSTSGVDASLMDNESVRYNSSVTFRGKGQPLILIDGEKASVEEMKEMDIDRIESFQVFKDKEAIKRYGGKGENGVILITLKKDAPL